MKEKLKKVFSTKKGKAGGAIAVILIAALTGNALLGGKSDVAIIEPTNFSTLATADLTNTVSYTGSVTTDDNINVYSSESYEIKDVRVKENDTVKAGDVLFVLNGDKLDDQIEQLEAQLNVTGANAAAQVNAARNRYNAAVRALNNNTNASIVSAENQITAARNQYESAKKSYEDLVRSQDQGYNSSILSLDQAVESAQTAINQAQLSLDQAKERLATLEQDKLDADADYAYYTKLRDSIQADLNSLNRKLTEETQDISAENQTAVANATSRLNSASTALNSFVAAHPDYNSDPALNTQYNRLKYDFDIAQDHYNYVAQEAYYTTNDRTYDLQRDITAKQYELNDATSKRATADATINSYDSTKQSYKQAIDSAQTAVDQAKQAKRQAETNRTAAVKNLDDNTKTALLAMNTAADSLAAAEDSYRVASEAADTELQTYEDSLATAEAGADQSASLVQLAQLYETKKKLTITAPADGTVLSITGKKGGYATAGTPLAVIKPMNNKIVEISLKEIDMTDVKLGQSAVITADGSGKMKYKGRIVDIAPVSEGTTASALAGSSVTGAATGAMGSTAENTFVCKVQITNPDGRIKPGMKATVKILLAEEDGIYAVPYSSLFDVDDTHAKVYAAIKNNDDKDDTNYTLKAIKVTTGLENDFSIVIEGSDLEDNMLILTDPDDYTDGQKISIQKSADDGGDQ